MKNKYYIPADGLAGLKENFKKDALSGFLVFLLALPLSLGIAKASDFPAIFGIVTAIIGGVLVSFFSGSRLTIKGPAAGLIVICSGAVSAFGGGEIGWQMALAAIVVAGVIQIIFGLLKLGKLADFFPGAAIHGMLAAIGIIIMSKQIHVLLGINSTILKGKEPLELLAMIPESILHENAHLTEIGIACLAILILFSIVKNQKIKKIPAPLIVLFVAIPLGLFLDIKHEPAVMKYALVSIGNVFDVYKNGFFKADFSVIISHTGEFLMYVVLFSLIGTLESLLTAKAIDGLDPYNRKSDFDKDLVAVGVGNTLSGLVGGLPMISEVARSSANVSNGGVTRWANFFHGVFLLLAILFAVPLIEMIPNAALAAMLIFVGFKLAHPKEFIHMWHVGKDQFILFTTTVIVTLATDLLIGVGVGILLEMIFNLAYGLKIKNLFSATATVHLQDSQQIVVFRDGLSFSNVLSLKKIINNLDMSNNIILDVSQATVVDHTTMLVLSNFMIEMKRKELNVEIVGLENHLKKGHSETSTRVLK
ncbi:MAG: hypothetical protein K2Q03_09570 [Sphingobacteriaceae bacterium]|nr:hypothetical protein [Sphingobacteriaceae bacterium]